MNHCYIFAPITVKLDKPLEISASVDLGAKKITADFGSLTISGRCHHETYDGTYEVTPTFSKQTLNTHNKLMTDDLTVRPIEVSRTSNPQGGKTIFIGGIE